MIEEPQQAFPYKPPTAQIKKRYEQIFNIKTKVQHRLVKIIFDKSLSLFLLILTAPLLLIIKMAYFLEGLIIPENHGPMIYSYDAVSHGEIFPKYKLRVIKMSCVDPELSAKGSWLAHAKEWDPDCRTYTGSFVKKFYLDELPQLYSIFTGKMSFVGPRPLSKLHYERDLSQGNVTRKIIRGGLLGLGHIHKGKSDFGNPIYEYQYAEVYINGSSLSLLVLDIKIILKGIILVVKGGGH